MKFRVARHLLFFLVSNVFNAYGKDPFVPFIKTIAVDQNGYIESAEYRRTIRTVEGVESSVDNDVTSKCAKFERTLSYSDLPSPVSGLQRNNDIKGQKMTFTSEYKIGPIFCTVIHAFADTNNCRADTNSEGMMSPAPPILIITGGTEICVDERTTITATECAGKVVWSNGHEGYALSAPIGSYTAVCVINGSKSEKSLSVTIHLSSDCNVFTISPVSVVLCPNQSVVLNAAGCDGTINWSTGESGTGITVDKEGEYMAVCSTGEVTVANVKAYINTSNADINAPSGIEIPGAPEAVMASHVNGTPDYKHEPLNFIGKPIRTPRFQLAVSPVFEGKATGCSN